MIRSSESVEVARTPAEVFDYVADIRNEPSWHDDVASVPPGTDAVPVVGKTYPVTFKPFMGKTAGEFTAVEVVPGSKVVYEISLGGITPRVTYTVEPAGTGARFTRSVEMRPRGLLVVMTPMMSMMVPKRNKVYVANLKRVLEA